MKTVEGLDAWVVEDVADSTEHSYYVFKTENDARLKFCELVCNHVFFAEIEEIWAAFDRGRFDDGDDNRRWADDVGNEVLMARSVC